METALVQTHNRERESDKRERGSLPPLWVTVPLGVADVCVNAAEEVATESPQLLCSPAPCRLGFLLVLPPERRRLHLQRFLYWKLPPCLGDGLSSGRARGASTPGLKDTMHYFWIHTVWIPGVAFLFGFQGKGSFSINLFFPFPFFFLKM